MKKFSLISMKIEDLDKQNKFLVKLTQKDIQGKRFMVMADYNEYLAIKHFTRLNYDISKLVYQKRVSMNPRGWENVKNIYAIDKLDISRHRKLINFLKKTDIKGLPDFIVESHLFTKTGKKIKRENTPFFVECKCDPKRITEEQSKKFRKLMKMGYKVFIFITKIKKFEIEYDKTQLIDFDTWNDILQ